jgi:hypothetical protein
VRGAKAYFFLLLEVLILFGGMFGVISQQSAPSMTSSMFWTAAHQRVAALLDSDRVAPLTSGLGCPNSQRGDGRKLQVLYSLYRFSATELYARREA